MKEKINQIVFLTLIGLTAALGARGASILPEPISLIATPESPSPGEGFNVEATAPTFDRNSADFTWYVDGKARPDLSGVGKSIITLTAGDTGSVLTVGVEVLESNGKEASAEIDITTADLVLTWFSETYVPKWYKGKALPIPGSVVNIVAIPKFIFGNSEISPDRLIYTWTLDEELDKFIGVGERVFKIRVSPSSQATHRVSVVVEDPRKQIRKIGDLMIVPSYPKILIYSSSPLAGTEIRTGDSLTSSARGLLDFTAEPFFFPVSSRQDLFFKWWLDENEIQGEARNPFMLTIDTSKASAGMIPIKVEVKEAEGFGYSLSRVLNLLLR